MLIEDSSVDTSAELVKKLEDEILCSIRKLGFILNNFITIGYCYATNSSK